MKKLNLCSASDHRRPRLITYLAATATVAALTLAASAWTPRANANEHNGSGDRDRVGEWLQANYEEAQVAALDQLLADFHGALSYGGNITALMDLWAPHSTLAFNGTPYVGNAAIQTFFLSGGYFKNLWVSLAPEYKTQITVHGDTATLSTQCVGIDLKATPNAVTVVIQVNATAVKHGEKWFFTSMNNASGAPL